MKNVVILHGTGETPEYMWLPWLKKELEKKGYSVSIPQLPDTDHPTLTNWLPAALKENYNEETILIGHSAGGPLQLSVLENINVKIKQAILVAGYARRKGEEKVADPIVQKIYDWKKIADHVDDIIFVNSDNDPWGCNDIEGRYMLDTISKGKLIVMKGEGHMGSEKFNQHYNKFPFLLKLVD
ncbi:MAG TPA: alpha/beta hydrolase [Methylomirabilota bacterium]|nr:alpha/beta hydrolase [Methylomirabilota bacterium]